MTQPIRRTRSRRSFAAVGVIAALAVVAAGCGDDDDAASTDTTAAAEDGATDTTAADGGSGAATGTPIRLGALIDVSGPASGFQGTIPEVIDAWVAETNANGGISGHPIEIVVEDTRGDAPTSVAAGEEFVADDTIAGIIIVDSSGEAALGDTLTGSLPVVGGAGYNPTVWHAKPNWFGITTSFPNVVNEQVIAAVEAGATVVASAPCAEVPACSAATPIFEAAAGTLGVEYAGQIEIAGDAPDYTAECLEFINRGAEFIQLSVNNTVATRLAADCTTQGYDGFFGASAGTVTSSLYEEIKLTGGLHGFPWYVDEEPVVRYREIMEAQGVEEANWAHPTATATYASLELFKQTIEANPEGLADDALTRDEVIAAYGTVANETLDGLLPNPITFTADQPAPPVPCFWLYSAEGGEITGDFEPECGEDFGF